MAKNTTPKEGIPGEARYWLYMFDGMEGFRCGWTTAKSRAKTWTKQHPSGWAYDRQTGEKF